MSIDHRLSSKAGAWILMATVLSGTVLGQDPAVPTQEKMVLDMLRASAKARHPHPEWSHARHESLGLLFTPLQLMVDLGMDRPWNPLGAFAIDGSNDPIVVTASEDTVDRLESRLGWMSLEAGGQMGFGARAVNRGASARELPTCWAYEGVIHADGGQLDTRFLWPNDGWFDQAHCVRDIAWDSQSLSVCGLTSGIQSDPHWPGVDQLSPRASLSWLARYHFDTAHQLLDPDDRSGKDSIVVRDLAGHVIRDISLDFEGERLDRMVIRQRPIKVTYSLGTIERKVEGVDRPESIPVIDEHVRWVDGVELVIDFVEVGDFGDAPRSIRVSVEGREMLLAEFEWIKAGDTLVEPSVTPDYGSYDRIQSEFIDAWSECSLLDRANAPRVFSDRMKALAIEVAVMSEDVGLGAAEPLRMLERRFMLSLMSPIFRHDSIEGDMLISLLKGPYREQVRALPRKTAMAEAIRQLIQNRPLLALATVESLGKPQGLNDTEAVWWDAMQATVREWARSGQVRGGAPERGRANDVVTPQLLLNLRMQDGRPR